MIRQWHDSATFFPSKSPSTPAIIPRATAHVRSSWSMGRPFPLVPSRVVPAARLSTQRRLGPGKSLHTIRPVSRCLLPQGWVRPGSSPLGVRAGLGDRKLRRLDRRHIHIPPIFLPPVLFIGLLVALWIWKCTMMIVFQNRIIYMPGLPPTARWERIADYAKQCRGIQWREERTKAGDGTDLGMAVATVRVRASPDVGRPVARVYILYFQGNASSIPPRLPDISWILRNISDNPPPVLEGAELTFVCLSYRGYWTSRGRPSEPGLRLDAEAGAQWIFEHHQRTCGKGDPAPILLVWGQSIGCGVATNLAATGKLPPGLPVKGLILETPFLSVRTVLLAVYPSKWVPYRYLWPFLRNHLDSWRNMELIADRSRKQGEAPPRVFILEAQKDELVPQEHGDVLQQRCLELEVPVEKAVSPLAFHSEAIGRVGGRALVVQAIVRMAEQALINHGGTAEVAMLAFWGGSKPGSTPVTSPRQRG